MSVAGGLCSPDRVMCIADKANTRRTQGSPLHSWVRLPPTSPPAARMIKSWVPVGVRFYQGLRRLQRTLCVYVPEVPEHPSDRAVLFGGIKLGSDLWSVVFDLPAEVLKPGPDTRW